MPVEMLATGMQPTFICRGCGASTPIYSSGLRCGLCGLPVPDDKIARQSAAAEVSPLQPKESPAIPEAVGWTETAPTSSPPDRFSPKKVRR